MRTLRIIKIFFSNSLWGIPFSVALALVLLALALLAIDGASQSQNYGEEAFLDLGFRTLQTLLASMVTVFGVALPLTFSLLLRTASEFSPMALRVSRQQIAFKILIGLILGVVLYLIVVLSHISFSFSPKLPITSSLSGIGLVVVALSLIPVMFDQLIRQIEPTRIAHALAKDLKQMLFELELVEPDQDLDSLTVSQTTRELFKDADSIPILSTQSGYVVEIDYEAIVEVLEKQGLTARIDVRVGSFTAKESVLMKVSASDRSCIEDLQEILPTHIRIGRSRKNIGDRELQLDELVSIAVKALSPAVNNLGTAIQCLDQIEEVVAIMLNRRFESGLHHDSSETLRLASNQCDYRGFVHAAFDRIRQNGGEQPAIAIKVLQILARLIARCHQEARAEVLREIAREYCPSRLEQKLSANDYRDIKRHLDEILDGSTENRSC